MPTSIQPTFVDALLVHRRYSYTWFVQLTFPVSCGRTGIQDNDVPRGMDFSPMNVGSLRNEST
jgi:hypothetical protein